MPFNREPHIYQGYVISQISKNAGQAEEMEYGEAQNCVLSGSHRWADDETDLPNHVKALIADREQKETETDEANAELNAKLRAEREARARDEANARGGYILMTAVGDERFLARPFPDTAVFDKSLIGTDATLSLEEDGDERNIVISLANASAKYRVKLEDEISLLGELLEHTSPDVDIPEDWRDKKALQLAAMAKKIRGTSDKMTGDEARAIIEDWTKTDDQVSLDASTGGGEGKKTPDTENRNKSDVEVDKDGKPVLSPEERAQQAAREGLDKDDSDFF